MGQSKLAPAAESSAPPVELRFTARAGLLPELSGQTYDSLQKALREVVMNAADARASLVSIDFSRVSTGGKLVVEDDGVGMSLAEVRDRFLSVGGSRRFEDNAAFGRIGIGSLALLRYGESAHLTTKRSGSRSQVEAVIRHPGQMSGGDREQSLDSIVAGTAFERKYSGRVDDHFTRIEIRGANEAVWCAAADANEFFALLEALQRILPLPWTEDGAWSELKKVAPEVVEAVRAEIDQWSIPVVVVSEWGERLDLRRRCFGDGRGTAVETLDAIAPVDKLLRVPDQRGTRRIRVAGFLGAQAKPVTNWSGITARVQNVAIETATFFGVTSDPGFRKYVTGELYCFGDLETSRLINIDRSSFNQEAADYQAIRNFMAGVVHRFKSEHVQRPQRAKVLARKILEGESKCVLGMQRVLDAAHKHFGDEYQRLPSSRLRRYWSGTTSPLKTQLEESGIHVVVRPDLEDESKPYRIRRLSEQRVAAEIAPSLVEPVLRFGTSTYRVLYADGGAQNPPVVIRNRPLEIVLNTGHPLNRSNGAPSKVPTSLAMEAAMAFATAHGDLDPHEVAIELLVHA